KLVSGWSRSRRIWAQDPVVGSHSRMLRSHPLVASTHPSGRHATPYTVHVWPRNTRGGLRPSTSQRQTSVSEPTLASWLPSGLQATHCTCSVWPESCWRRRPPSPSSQSLTLPSQLALARLVPSGAKASPRTQLLCPARISTQAALPRDGISHSRMVPATSPLASRRPSGLQASEVIGPGCGTSCRGVPSFASHSRIVASCP